MIPIFLREQADLEEKKKESQAKGGELPGTEAWHMG